MYELSRVSRSMVYEIADLIDGFARRRMLSVSDSIHTRPKPQVKCDENDDDKLHRLVRGEYHQVLNTSKQSEPYADPRVR